MYITRCHFCTYFLTCSSRLALRSWTPSSSRLRLISAESKALFLQDFNRAFARVAIFKTGRGKAQNLTKKRGRQTAKLKMSREFFGSCSGWRASTSKCALAQHQPSGVQSPSSNLCDGAKWGIGYPDLFGPVRLRCEVRWRNETEHKRFVYSQIVLLKYLDRKTYLQILTDLRIEWEPFACVHYACALIGVIRFVFVPHVLSHQV